MLHSSIETGILFLLLISDICNLHFVSSYPGITTQPRLSQNITTKLAGIQYECQVLSMD